MRLRFFTKVIFIGHCILFGGINACLDLSNVTIGRYDVQNNIMYECKKLSAQCPNLVAECTKTTPPVYSVYIRMNTVCEQNQYITDPKPEAIFAQIEHDYYFDKLRE